MSYRSFKHLLGETTLERRCRLSIGLIIVVLVSASFFWYGWRIDNLIRHQEIQAARMLVGPALLDLHDKALAKRFGRVRDLSQVESISSGDVFRHKARMLVPARADDPARRPCDEFERATLARFIQSAATHKPGPLPETTHTFADGTPSWAEQIARDRVVYPRPGRLKWKTIAYGGIGAPSRRSADRPGSPGSGACRWCP